MPSRRAFCTTTPRGAKNLEQSSVSWVPCNRAEWWPFVVCLEAHGKEQSYEVAQTCAQKQSMEWTRIDECATGELGYNLGMMYYRETAALDPPHEYTPWLTLNGRV